MVKRGVKMIETQVTRELYIFIFTVIFGFVLADYLLMAMFKYLKKKGVI